MKFLKSKSLKLYLVIFLSVSFFIYEFFNAGFLTFSENVNELKTTNKVEFYKDFIGILNSKNLKRIDKFIANHYSNKEYDLNKKSRRQIAHYWISTIKEYGKLNFYPYSLDSYRGNSIAWAKGIYSKDWLGFNFKFNKKGKISNTNILRSCIPSSINKKKNKNTSLSAIHQYMETLEKNNIFSGSVLIAKGDSILHKGYYGFSDIKSKQRLSSENKLAIASTTKLFTTIAIAKLVEENKLELNKPIARYLKDFPETIGNMVTVKHLLNHTSGIELDDFSGFLDEIRKTNSINEFYKINLKYLKKLENYENYETLKRFNYSNENFDILGKLIEVASGVTYKSYITNLLIHPLELNSTGFFRDKIKVDNLVSNYQINRLKEGSYDDGYREMVPKSEWAVSRPGGSLYSSVNDLYKLLKAINKNKIITEITKDKFLSDQQTILNLPFYESKYGLGIYLNKRYGHKNIGHAGGIPGSNTRCEYYPELDIYVIVISNYNGAANIVANYISEQL